MELEGLRIKELPEEDNYKYLGMDESIGYDGPLNKNRVTSEYKKRVRKIWSSELNNINKVQAHNTFAVPVLTPTIGVLPWTKKEIKDLDILTRKQMSMQGSFHVSSDVNRLYARRSEGGRGLTSIEEMYKRRTTGIAERLEEAQKDNSMLKLVKQHEQKHIMRLAKESKEQYSSDNNAKLKDNIKKEYEGTWKGKVTHGYFQTQTESDDEINKTKSIAWLKQKLSSHMEGYICAIQEQELKTREALKRREKDPAKKSQMITTCHVCHKNEENIFHLVCSCPHLAHTIYLNDRHNQVARIVYQEITTAEKLEYDPPPVKRQDNQEIWWDKYVKTANKIKKNRPDITIWDTQKKICQIVEVSVPLDMNLSQVREDKESKYLPLISQMQRMYNNYKIEVIPVLVGALGSIPHGLKQNLQRIGTDKARIETVTQRIQKAALIGSVTVCKTALKNVKERTLERL